MIGIFLANQTVSVNTSDNDTPGVTVLESLGNTIVRSKTDTFTVVLDTQPANDVVIDIASSDTSEGTTAPTAITFTLINWNTPQTVTLTGIDDNIVDGNINYNVDFVVNDALSDDTYDSVADLVVAID